MPLFGLRSSLVPVFIAGFFASSYFISQQSDSFEQFAQIAAGFCLDGAVFVGLIELLSQRQSELSEKRRRIRLKASLVNALAHLEALVAIDADSDDEDARLRIQVYHTNLKHTSAIIDSLVPCAAMIDTEHMEVFCALAKALHRALDVSPADSPLTCLREVKQYSDTFARHNTIS